MATSPQPKGQILVIDDEPDIRASLSDLLRLSGYIVNTAETGHQGLEWMMQYLPDVVLLDVKLPDLDGYLLCQSIKAHPQTKDIPVIFISAWQDEMNRAFDVGAADYITKPFHNQEVIARVENQLTIQRLQKQLVQQQTQRLMQFSGTTPLLSHLQRRLHQQAQLLQERNVQLRQEIQERQQAEAALRAEQEVSERLLLNILPSAIAEQLKRDDPGELAERLDNVTILFADIVDFTPLAAQLPPLEVVSILNHVFSAFDRLTEELGLEKIKTIGDAYMVAAGVPVPRDDHAEVIIEMAIAMRKTLKQVNQETGYPLQIRIGVNTGTVVAGVIGLKKFSYDLWGDAVNIASRMESQGFPGKIQVTEVTYQRLKNKYHFEPWGNVKIKGRGSMLTYLLVGRHADIESASP